MELLSVEEFPLSINQQNQANVFICVSRVFVKCTAHTEDVNSRARQQRNAFALNSSARFHSWLKFQSTQLYCNPRFFGFFLLFQVCTSSHDIE
mmetsp:Transcript_16509/g.32040  ORF Transcript_16509/g.32040 Transcript_16509/m.32040 type:complete len:93 (+) Transcript_16509:371-649(+)